MQYERNEKTKTIKKNMTYEEFTPFYYRIYSPPVMPVTYIQTHETKKLSHM